MTSQLPSLLPSLTRISSYLSPAALKTSTTRSAVSPTRGSLLYTGITIEYVKCSRSSAGSPCRAVMPAILPCPGRQCLIEVPDLVSTDVAPDEPAPAGCVSDLHVVVPDHRGQPRWYRPGQRDDRRRLPLHPPAVTPDATGVGVVDVVVHARAEQLVAGILALVGQHQGLRCPHREDPRIGQLLHQRLRGPALVLQAVVVPAQGVADRGCRARRAERQGRDQRHPAWDPVGNGLHQGTDSDRGEREDQEGVGPAVEGEEGPRD